MAFGLLPISPAAADHPTPPAALDFSEACANAPEDVFTDDDTSIHESAIDCIAFYEITTGTSATTYGPAEPVRRDQMATFIANLIDYASDNGTGEALPAAPATNPFTCPSNPALALTTTNVHYDNILRLAEAGVVSGGVDGNPDNCYGPGLNVLRGQMATFIVAGLEYSTGNDIASTTDYFVDDDTNVHESNINAGASEGLIAGRGVNAAGHNIYEPNDDIRRDQMAAFLARSVQYLVNEDVIEPKAGPATTNQTFTVTPGLTLTEAGTVTQFSVGGITTSVVDIALVDCANIATDADGVTTFQNSSNPGGTGNVANLTGVDPGITIGVVNGAAVTAAQYQNNVAVKNGTVTFSTTNNGADCFVAVIFNDADSDNNIDLGTNNQPTEVFGNSGDINVVPPEAADSSVIDATVLQNSALANLFIGTFPNESSTGARTYYYDTNDEFLLEAGAVDTVLTIEQFEARLSPGDLVDGTYRNEPANQSRFILTDQAPLAPANVVAKAPDGTNAGKAGIEVEFSDSITASVVKYDIFRATATQPTITGQSVTCPTIASGAYADIADVTDNKTTGTYEFLDSTATVAPTATPTNPSYCYYVVAVDKTGDVGPASNIAGPQTATAGDTSGAPEFIGTGNSYSGTTVTVNYDEDIKGTSTDADASNYEVTVTRGGVTTALTEVSTTDVDANTVTITVSGIPGGTFQVGDTVVVTAKVGTDGNTVLDLTDVAQPVGNAVQVTSNADAVAPGVTSGTGSVATNNFTLNFNEPINQATLTCADINITDADADSAAGPTCSGITFTDTDTAVIATTGEVVEAGDTATLAANSVADLAGNVGPAAPFTTTAAA